MATQAATIQLSGPQKAAIALMVLGDEGASPFLRHFQEDELEKVAREIAAMGAVSPEVGEQVLAELNATASGSHVPAGGVEQARRLLKEVRDHINRVLSHREKKRSPALERHFQFLWDPKRYL